jgi:hypothetical protein
VVGVAEVVDLVVAVTPVVAVSKAVASMVADKSQVVLAPAVEASALVERASEVVFRTLKGQDPAFLRLGILRTRSLSVTALVNKPRV